eukprot:5019357-Prymnesium_polylepis.3
MATPSGRTPPPRERRTRGMPLIWQPEPTSRHLPLRAASERQSVSTAHPWLHTHALSYPQPKQLIRSPHPARTRAVPCPAYR